MRVARTVPFLTMVGSSSPRPVLLVDRVEVTVPEDPAPLAALLGRPLRLPAGALSVDEAAALVTDQYRACHELIFSQPLFERLRNGQDGQALLAYIWETRHYLNAAPFRMASGVGAPTLADPVAVQQARHVVEEAFHNVYFERSLCAMGITPAVVASSRPIPTTVEWIQVMHAVAATSPLCASLCSGLLESTNRERQAIREWHGLMADHGFVPREAIDAIYEHVGVDLELGHGENWRDALELTGPVCSRELAHCLNAVTVVAEMITRWVQSLLTSSVGALVDAARQSAWEAPPDDRSVDSFLDGLPVWPSEVLSSMTHGFQSPLPGVRTVMTKAFVLDRCLSGDDDVDRNARRSRSRLGADITTGVESDSEAETVIDQWMRAIDGHQLWRAMMERKDPVLALGWLVENYHYIDAITSHVPAGIASCSDPQVRGWMVHHLEEEFSHSQLLQNDIAKGIDEFFPYPIEALRPLPTTVAFVGGLRQLARRDWVAYALAIVFLQLTLRPHNDLQRHEAFYQRASNGNPVLSGLLGAMRSHDQEDEGLGHELASRTLLKMLSARTIPRNSWCQAALIPQLCWSFLDGILEHYQHGAASLVGRIGWTIE